MSDSMCQDLLDHICVIFRNLAMRPIVVQDDLGSIHLWEIHLQSVGMYIDDVVLYCHLVSATVSNSVKDITWACPQGIKLVAILW